MKNSKLMWVVAAGAAAIFAYAMFGMRPTADTTAQVTQPAVESTTAPIQATVTPAAASPEVKKEKKHSGGCCPPPAEANAEAVTSL